MFFSGLSDHMINYFREANEEATERLYSLLNETFDFYSIFLEVFFEILLFLNI